MEVKDARYCRMPATARYSVSAHWFGLGNDIFDNHHRPETFGTCGSHGPCHENPWWERIPAEMPDTLLDQANHSHVITVPIYA